MIRQPEYVGIDLHRRRSVIVRKDHDGTVIDTVRIDNDPLVLARVIGDAGPDPEVVMEATGGWYWAADVITDCGGRLHLSHPEGNDWGHRRVKNDVRDAEDLADLLRLAAWPRRGSPPRRSASCASWSDTGSSCASSAPACAVRFMPCSPRKGSRCR